MARNSVVLLICCCSLTVSAQTNRYIVFFSDKNDSPFSLNAPEDYLSERAILRRTTQHIELNIQDLPVNPGYIQTIRDMDIPLYYPSKWFNAVLVQCSVERVTELEALPFVTRVFLAAPGSRLPVSGRVGGVSQTLFENDFQLSLHGIDLLQAAGYKGEEMHIAVMDGGFISTDTLEAFQHLYTGNQVLLTRNFVSGGENVYTGISHGTNVLSILAGQLSNYQGIAPRASYLLFLTEDGASEYPVEEYNWLVAAEMADSAGADVINTSLGYSTFDDPADNYTYEDMDGTTTMISRAATLASERGMLVVVSAGNEGNGSWKYITAPADADPVLTVGAVDLTGQPAGFSSYGPTADGRIKPEVASLGVQTSLIAQNGNVDTGNGTSFSAPVITGFATLLWQQHSGFSNQELKDYIIDLTGNTDIIDNQIGYGVPFIQQVPTATEDPNLNEMPQLYPVPARGMLNIRFAQENPGVSIEIYGMDGRLYQRYENITGQQVTLDLHEVHGGALLFRIQTGRYTVHRLVPVE